MHAYISCYIVYLLRATVSAGDVVALLIGCRTCDLQVTGSSPGWVSLLLTSVCAPLSPTV